MKKKRYGERGWEERREKKLEGRKINKKEKILVKFIEKKWVEYL